MLDDPDELGGIGAVGSRGLDELGGPCEMCFSLLERPALLLSAGILIEDVRGIEDTKLLELEDRAELVSVYVMVSVSVPGSWLGLNRLSNADSGSGLV